MVDDIQGTLEGHFSLFRFFLFSEDFFKKKFTILRFSFFIPLPLDPLMPMASNEISRNFVTFSLIQLKVVPGHG